MATRPTASNSSPSTPVASSRWSSRDSRRTRGSDHGGGSNPSRCRSRGRPRHEVGVKGGDLEAEEGKEPVDAEMTSAPPAASSEGGLAGYFRFAERGTDLVTETRAGITTFLVMAYIIFLNGNII